jgi:dinuclear metal center YbgI/SA1388 family protein
VNHVEVSLAEVVVYLDAYLNIRAVPDDANAVNGLQVENSGTVSHIIAAVDASQGTIDALTVNKPRGSPLLVVHHGLLWDGNQPVVGRRFRRLRSLLQQNAAVYSAHIPLDLHPEVGNNTVLARRLGLTDLTPFGTHKGVAIGVSGRVSGHATTRSDFSALLARTLGIAPSTVRLIAGGAEQVTRVGVITGGAGSAIAEALSAGCDSFVTGEGAAHTYFDAMELGMNVFYAGHYATETLGVQALAAHLGGQFGLPWAFHNHPTGM